MPAYPEPSDKHPTVVFHLTLARQHSSDLDLLETEFYRSYGASLPIRAVATEISLYEKRAERWFKEASFPFGPSTVVPINAADGLRPDGHLRRTAPGEAGYAA